MLIIYQTIFRGKGLEFDSYRNFSDDEDYSMLDWKASLRANEPLAKQYVEERDLDIYFAVDVSNGMLFGSGDKLKAEYAAEVVAVLSHLIVNSGDNIGLLMFSDKVVKFLPATKSKNYFSLFMKFLSDTSLYGGGLDLEPMLNLLINFPKSPSTVIILVSDFIHLKKGFDKKLRLLTTRFETIGLMVRDIMDEELPRTHHQIVVQDPYSNKQILVDPMIAAERYKENSIRQKNIVKKLFFDAGIDMLEMKTNQRFSLLLASFLRQRAGGKGI